MKKMMIALMAMLTIAATASAMSYEQARQEALFLTDKMAYELNLTAEQYEAAYEINLDYLMGVTSYDDVYGTYWERRNLDLSYVLLDWQWNAFRAATYFYRPLYWDAGYWHFGVYARYPHRDYFYFGRPAFYVTYRGAHAWHHVGGHGWYHGRRDHFRPQPGRNHFGMRDGWNRGDYRGGRPHGGRPSSTRTTVNNRDNRGHGNNRHDNNGYRGNGNNNRGNSNGYGASRPANAGSSARPSAPNTRPNTSSARQYEQRRSNRDASSYSAPRSSAARQQVAAPRQSSTAPRQSSAGSAARSASPARSGGSSYGASRSSGGSSSHSNNSRGGGFGSHR